MADRNRQPRRSTTTLGGWVCPSTRAFLEAARQTPGYSRFDLAHGYVYARWPYLYIAIGTGEHWLSGMLQRISRLWGWLAGSKADGAGVAEDYHGKVVTTQAARQLVSVQREVQLRQLEQVIPFHTARDIVLKHPDHIVVLDCPCRSARPNPCQPLDVCLIVGEPFAGLVAEHHPLRARWIDSQEACAILQAEHARGHVHHAFFKDAMLGRFYAICNCCPCCCGAMQAMRNGTPMLIASGYTSQIDASRCIGCGECTDRCPFGAMLLQDGAARADREKCMGCGVCVTACELGAAMLVRDPCKGEPLEIDALVAQAAKSGENPGQW